MEFVLALQELSAAESDTSERAHDYSTNSWQTCT